jgi:thymidylate synthase
MKGQECSPRGEKVTEIENFSYNLPPYYRFCNFKSRKLNINYIKKEFLWYLKGNKNDASICEYAKMWKGLINDDGSINSNYGQYIFGDQKQFERCRDWLVDDKDSRRASIVILSNEHLKTITKDYPCTYSINFRIRDNYLNMSVNMRSQDGIFGMGNDAPCFSFIHEMMYESLKYYYPRLKYGLYHHHCDSFHVYEKHYKMLDKITLFRDEFTEVACPKILNKEEVDYLIENNFNKTPKDFKFTKWLLNK